MPEIEAKENLEALPDYEAGWQLVKDTHWPTGLIRPRSKNIVETFNAINLFWRDKSQEVRDRYSNLIAATKLPNIPDLEIRDALNCARNTAELWEKVRSTVKSGLEKVKHPWKTVLNSKESAINLTTTGQLRDEQATILLESISEAKDLNLKPEEMRMLIAQHAFDEVFDIGAYRMYDHTGLEDEEKALERTTVDPPPIESNELSGALKRKPWTEKERKLRLKIYSAWKSAIEDDSNSVDPDVAIPLITELWNSTKGKRLVRKSALHVLQRSEDLYQALEDGGAFDIDLDDFWDEEAEDEDLEEEDQEEEQEE